MADAIAPHVEEFAVAENWWNTHFGPNAGTWPFSFVFDGKPVRASDWQCAREENGLDDRRDELVLTATQPAHGLEMRCVAIRYRNFPVVEWTVHLRQTDAGRCPFVSDLQGLDAEWREHHCVVRTGAGRAEHMAREGTTALVADAAKDGIARTAQLLDQLPTSRRERPPEPRQ
jgi:hypothetical protein